VTSWPTEGCALLRGRWHRLGCLLCFFLDVTSCPHGFQPILSSLYFWVNYIESRLDSNKIQWSVVKSWPL
jgi:hypothetical protein